MSSSSYLYNNEHEPSKLEFTAVGVIGILLYFFTGLSGVYAYTRLPTTKESKKFYISLVLMSICELPRYFVIAKTQQYTSPVAYGFHVIGIFFYFACLAIVILQFAHILELGPYVSLLYSKTGLQVAVAIQGLVDFATFIGCCATATLSQLFKSDAFFAFSIFVIIENLTYTSFMSFYGFRLIGR